MAHRSSAGARRSPRAPHPPMDPERVLEMLRELIPQVSSPVVQECLRSARCEIAFLTSSDAGFPEEDEEDEDGPDEVLRRGDGEAA